MTAHSKLPVNSGLGQKILKLQGNWFETTDQMKNKNPMIRKDQMNKSKFHLIQKEHINLNSANILMMYMM